MLASVSEQALKAVKVALQKFQADMSGAANRVVSQADGHLMSARTKILSVKREVDEAETKARDLENKLIFLKDKIREYEHKRNDARYQMQQHRNQASALENQKGGLENQMRACQNSQDPDAGAKASSLQNQIAALDRQINEQKSLAAREEQNMHMFENEIRNYEIRRDQCRAEAEAAQEQVKKLKSKVSRMESAYRQMQRDMQDYIDAARQFSQEADRMATHNMGAIGKCLYYVEKYMNQGL